jgi:hypothetical protein
VHEKIAEHTLQIRQHIVVPVADNGDALRRKPLRSAAVGLLPLFRMLTTVHFDSETESRTVEIDGVGAMLFSEREAMELIAAKRMPQARLCISHVGAERSRASGHIFRAGKA